VEFLATHEDFIFPRFRQKQVLEFLKDPLNDLCISRPRERLEWGIPLPFDEAYVTYVWFDALINYYSAVADQPGVWPATWHVIARTSSSRRTRCTGRSCSMPPDWRCARHHRPRLVDAEWIQDVKSTGNALNPLDLVGEFGVDAFRYFLIREMNVGQTAISRASNSSSATTANSPTTSATSSTAR